LPVSVREEHPANVKKGIKESMRQFWLHIVIFKVVATALFYSRLKPRLNKPRPPLRLLTIKNKTNQ
jgi:hypothetical protein